MGVPVLEAAQIREEMKYQMVVVKGEISSVWFEPRFVGGEPDEENPMHLYHNNVPCFQFQLVGEGATRVKMRLKPTKNGKPFIVFQDLDAIASVNNIDELINSLVGRTIVAGGTITRFNAGDTAWADMSVHFLMEADDLSQPVQRGVDFNALLADQAAQAPGNGGDWFPQPAPQPAPQPVDPTQVPVVYPQTAPVYPPQFSPPVPVQPPPVAAVLPQAQSPRVWTPQSPTTPVAPVAVPQPGYLLHQRRGEAQALLMPCRKARQLDSRR